MLMRVCLGLYKDIRLYVELPVWSFLKVKKKRETFNEIIALAKGCYRFPNEVLYDVICI